MRSNNLPKMLVLCRSVPPMASGSSTVMLNFLRQFSKEEMIAVGALKPDHPFPAWNDCWPKIIYAMWHPPFSLRGERWIRYAQWPFLFLISLLVLIFYRCKTILAVYPDKCFFFTGYLLSKITKKPLYLYFHNTFSDNNPNSLFSSWLQERAFRKSNHVFVMSEGIEKFYQAKYPDLSCSSLTHIIEKVEILPDEIILPPLHDPLRLVFIGNLNNSCAEAASRFLKWVQDNPHTTLSIYSGMSSTQIRNLGFTGERITVETLPYDNLVSRIKEGDILIHPHGFKGLMQPIEYETIFPTKTLEYLISQRPIIAHLPHDCFLAEFYRKHGCALIVDEPNYEALSDGMARICLNPELRLKLVKNALRAATEFQAEKVISGFRKKILSLEKYGIENDHPGSNLMPH
jgi:glycosyltransferase involved in cell wall biosynthesis